MFIARKLSDSDRCLLCESAVLT